MKEHIGAGEPRARFWSRTARWGLSCTPRACSRASARNRGTLSHPVVVKGIAEAYVAAGSDIVETNSFGGSSFKLKPYGLAGRGARVQSRRGRAGEGSDCRQGIRRRVGRAHRPHPRREGGDHRRSSCTSPSPSRLRRWPRAAPTRSVSRPCPRWARRSRRSGPRNKTASCR